MPRVLWPLVRGRPMVEVIHAHAQGGQPVQLKLLADTGAGTAQGPFELLLDENDCLLCGGFPSPGVILGGAYTGAYPIFLIRVQLPSLGFDHFLPAVGVPNSPANFDGIACFRFLNRFTFGNFGDAGQFGLET
jgi:hypothetical protein